MTYQGTKAHPGELLSTARAEVQYPVSDLAVAVRRAKAQACRTHRMAVPVVPPHDALNVAMLAHPDVGPALILVDTEHSTSQTN